MLVIVVHAANIQDRDGAKLVLEKAHGKFPRLKLIWADGGYAGKLIPWVWEQCQWVLEIIRRDPTRKGFYVLPRRWVVERTFAWAWTMPSTQQRLRRTYAKQRSNGPNRNDPAHAQKANYFRCCCHALMAFQKQALSATDAGEGKAPSAPPLGWLSFLLRKAQAEPRPPR